MTGFYSQQSTRKHKKGALKKMGWPTSSTPDTTLPCNVEPYLRTSWNIGALVVRCLFGGEGGGGGRILVQLYKDFKGRLWVITPIFVVPVG